MEEFDEMTKKMQEKMESELAAASMIFWQAEITGFWEGNPHSVTSAFFASEDTAHEWLLKAQTQIAPLDQWVDGKYEDDYCGIYVPFIYQLRTKD